MVAEPLETRRTCLAPFAVDELDELTTLFRNAEVRRFLLDDQIVDEGWVAAEISASETRFKTLGAGLWSIRLLGGAEIVGFVGFREFFDPPQLQLLYALHPDQWGRGLAKEVTEGICGYAFAVLGFARVSAAADVPNTASQRVLERVGMTRTHVLDEGQGTAFYSLSKAEWEAGRGAL